PLFRSSSWGTFRVPTSCAVSSPLPATSTTSPSRAISQAARIASARRGISTQHGHPSRTSARIRSGGSRRGLSSVRITRSASSAAISPIGARLARSRSPPAPTTSSTRPAVRARTAVSAVRRAAGLCAVSTIALTPPRYPTVSSRPGGGVTPERAPATAPGSPPRAITAVAASNRIVTATPCTAGSTTSRRSAPPQRPAPRAGGPHQIALCAARCEHGDPVGAQMLLEQPQLRAPVLLEAAVHVEMVPFEPRAHGHIDLDVRQQTVLQDPDERLERDRLRPERDLLGDQVRQELRRAAEVRRAHPPMNVGDPRRVAAGRAQPRRAQQLQRRRRDRGLAIGAGDRRDEGTADGRR